MIFEDVALKAADITIYIFLTGGRVPAIAIKEPAVALLSVFDVKLRGERNHPHPQGFPHAQAVAVLPASWPGKGQRPQQRAEFLWVQVLETDAKTELHPRHERPHPGKLFRMFHFIFRCLDVGVTPARPVKFVAPDLRLGRIGVVGCQCIHVVRVVAHFPVLYQVVLKSGRLGVRKHVQRHQFSTLPHLTGGRLKLSILKEDTPGPPVLRRLAFPRGSAENGLSHVGDLFPAQMRGYIIQDGVRIGNTKHAAVTEENHSAVFIQCVKNRVLFLQHTIITAQQYFLLRGDLFSVKVDQLIGNGQCSGIVVGLEDHRL